LSGFAGILHHRGAPVDPARLEAMIASLAFCGPDRQHTWTNGAVGLGHALLRTTADSARERQPSSLDGRAWIVADARVDGRRELLRHLSAAGEDPSPEATDDELILHAYRAWGERCVGRLIGDFAFAIWDEKAARLFCARDHFGVIPFYYANVPDGLVFGNVLRSLRGHPDVSDELDEWAVGDFLLFSRNRHLTRTVFAGISSLPPAHTLTAEDGTVRVRRYWDFPPERDNGRGSPRAHAELFAAVFDQAVADRLRTGAAGTHLSGGVDSTSVAATAAKHLKGSHEDADLRAYTVVFDTLIAEEEGRYAGTAAARIGLAIEYLTAEEYLFRVAPSVPTWVFPEPYGIADQSPEYELTRRVAGFARVLLTGLGGDPLFATQPVLPWPLGRAPWRAVARFAMADLMHRRRLPRLGIRTALRTQSGSSARVVPPLPDWIDPSFARRVGLAGRYRSVLSESRRAGPSAMLEPGWPRIFESAHPGALGLPVKHVFPFFDLRLVRRILTSPPLTRQDKWLLREAMRGQLPKPVLNRPKTPLYNNAVDRHDPANPWYKRACHPAIRRARRELLSASPIDRFADRARLERLIDAPQPTTSTLLPLENCIAVAYWLLHQTNQTNRI
jgi:asparagine synthase (glutamine-hydrolysing)